MALEHGDRPTAGSEKVGWGRTNPLPPRARRGEGARVPGRAGEARGEEEEDAAER